MSAEFRRQSGGLPAPMHVIFFSRLSVVESAALAQEGDAVDEQGSEGDSVGRKKVGHGFLLLDSVE